VDDALLDRLRRGDPEAYEAVLDRFEGPVFRFFYYTHGDRDRAEDQSGETFARLVASIRTLRGGAAAFRGYLFGIARDVLRAGRRNTRERAADPIELDRLAASGPSQADRAAAREEFARALAAIGEFPFPLRHVLLLRFVEGLSLEEVSQALDLPLNTVKSHIHRGRERLRKALDLPLPPGSSDSEDKNRRGKSL